MSKDFKPSYEQLRCATLVLIAQAFNETVKEAFAKIEQKIIDDAVYEVEPKYLEDPRGQLNEARILKVNDIPKIRGLHEYCKDASVSNDAARYYSELDLRTRNAGFRNGMNASCMADSDYRNACEALVRIMKPITKIEYDDIIMVDHRRKLIDLTLRLLVPFIGEFKDKEILQKAYYNDRMNHFGTPAIKEEIDNLLNALN